MIVLILIILEILFLKFKMSLLALILPILNFVLSLIYLLTVKAYSNLNFSEVIYSFLFYNISTVILFLIYYIYKRQ
ncbi:MAG: hypothetical protein RSD36_10280 [Terrisporobacter sp.]